MLSNPVLLESMLVGSPLEGDQTIICKSTKLIFINNNNYPPAYSNNHVFHEAVSKPSIIQE